MISSISRVFVQRPGSIIFALSSRSRLDRFPLITCRHLASCKFRNCNLQSSRLSSNRFKSRFPVYSFDSTRKASMVASATANSVTGKFERLPVIAKPSHYTISLKPDLEKFTFDGEETIQLEVRSFEFVFCKMLPIFALQWAFAAVLGFCASTILECFSSLSLQIVKATNFIKFYCSDIKIKDIQLNAKEGSK